MQPDSYRFIHLTHSIPHKLLTRCIRSLLLLLLALGACTKEPPTDSEDETNFEYGEQNFGASAADLLRDEKYNSLVVEIQYMDSYRPDEDALKALKDFLQAHLHKPRGIFFLMNQIPSVSDTILYAGQVDSIQRANRKLYTRNKRISLYILYTNGTYHNPDILGQAFRNTCIVIYGKAMKRYESTFGFPSKATIETTTLLHEMGHILGLVNKGSGMQAPHADSVNEAHCANPACIMYYKIPTIQERGPLLPKSVPPFDSACLQDLKNNGGR